MGVFENEVRTVLHYREDIRTLLRSLDDTNAAVLSHLRGSTPEAYRTGFANAIQSAASAFDVYITPPKGVAVYLNSHRVVGESDGVVRTEIFWQEDIKTLLLAIKNVTSDALIYLGLEGPQASAYRAGFVSAIKSIATAFGVSLQDEMDDPIFLSLRQEQPILQW